MTPSAVLPALTGLAPIGLAELTERAALLTRVDRKYALPAGRARELVEDLGEPALVLEIGSARSFAYESVYFDTPDLDTYLLAARRRRRRFKIRTRLYVESSLCWLEVKTRGPRGITVKHRLPYDRGHHTTAAPGRSFIDGVLAEESITALDHLALVPVLTTRYRRTTVFLPATGSRLTVDTDLSWEDRRGHRLTLPDLVVLETKTGPTASGVDRLLWARGHRPDRISKYATALAALRPELPAAPWQRTLRRHFAVAGPGPQNLS